MSAYAKWTFKVPIFAAKDGTTVEFGYVRFHTGNMDEYYRNSKEAFAKYCQEYDLDESDYRQVR